MQISGNSVRFAASTDLKKNEEMADLYGQFANMVFQSPSSTSSMRQHALNNYTSANSRLEDSYKRSSAEKDDSDKKDGSDKSIKKHLEQNPPHKQSWYKTESKDWRA